MNNNFLYKVLWVDDDMSIVKSTQINAESYNLQLVHCSNWKEAEDLLKKNFDEFSAIILDAECKMTKTNIEENTFINKLLPSLTLLFGEKQRFIPWYILSAGTMEGFTFTIKSANFQHCDYNAEWGNMLYMKDVEDSAPNSSLKLFENIRQIAKEPSTNIVLFRHQDVFKYLGEDRLIDASARKEMMKMLGALYYPEDNIKYEYAGNPIRKVLEYFFRAAHKQGLLADECFEKGRIILKKASLYMAGRAISYDRNDKKKGVKFGQDTDMIFPPLIAESVKLILDYSNNDSHTNEDSPYLVDEHNKEGFFGYVMLLCNIIKWFGKYVEKHPDIEANKQMKKFVVIEENKNQRNYKK